ncbi:RHS repeat-associated core domain-containing protein, partial [Flavobacterium salmonis]
IIEEDNYYPFGLKQSRHDNVVNTQGNATAQKYKFEGKEIQDELGLNWYDFGWRQYDPTLARMLQADPVTHHSQSPYTAFDNNPVFWADPDGAATIDPKKDQYVVISSSVDKHNVTTITQTTTTTITTTKNDGSVSVRYSSASITNKVDAEGNVTKGTTVTHSSGIISKNADGKISRNEGKSFSTEAKSGERTSQLNQWTNTVSSYNKTNKDGIYNVDMIDKTSKYTTKAFEAGISVFGAAGVKSSLSALSDNTKNLIGLLGGATSGDQAVSLTGEALQDRIGKNNNYAIVYGVQHIQNGAMMKEMKTPAGQRGSSRYSVGPTSWQDLWKGFKSFFKN